MTHSYQHNVGEVQRMHTSLAGLAMSEKAGTDIIAVFGILKIMSLKEKM